MIMIYTKQLNLTFKTANLTKRFLVSMISTLVYAKKQKFYKSIV